MGTEIKGFPAGYPSHTGIKAALALHPQLTSTAKPVMLLWPRLGADKKCSEGVICIWE
jgi:hypothetical protein